MKRHQVMDLFYGKYTEEKGEWQPVSTHPSNDKFEIKQTKVKVKLDDGSETFAYYYRDKCSWAKDMYKHLSHYWECSSHNPLYHVTEWKYLNMK